MRSIKPVWGYAFGYFACYVPYSGLTKAVTSGQLGEGVPGLVLLPATAVASVAGMAVFLLVTGWWRHASTWRGVPVPTRWTALSGLCTAGIIATTTLAYTLDGVSIVFMMLLMRGGVLMMAPLIDLVSGRSIRWFSALGLALSLAALVVAFWGGSTALSVLGMVDVALYLGCYLVRLRFMTKLAKSDDAANRRYFVEEQLVAAPAVVATLGAAALVMGGELGDAFRAGFAVLGGHPVLGWALLIGLLSQGTGICGGLILLEKEENSFCVPVNRASSILAGVAASAGLALLLDAPWPDARDLVGAGLVVAAIVVLSLPPLLASRR